MTSVHGDRSLMLNRSGASAQHEYRKYAAGIWGSLRPHLLLALPFVAVVGALVFFVLALRQESINAEIRALKHNHDVAAHADASAALVSARIEFLLSHDRVDEAQPYVEALDRHGDDAVRAAAHYNLANGRLRQGFDELTAGNLDKAGPYVILSRQEYRRALTFDPNNWDAKFNLDVASRLVRDFPAFERTIGDTVKVDRKKIWTDVPGKPEGLP